MLQVPYCLSDFSINRVWQCLPYLVKNKYTKINFTYIYFMLSILQMPLYMYVLNENTLQLYFYYTNLYT